ncbi:MAG: hypothetical protein J6M10_01760 [Clostridia bacterium]|nr:hypothetical protein [Clostridia bacterium]
MIPNATEERAEAILKMYAEAEERLLEIIARNCKGVDRKDPAAWVQKKLAQVRSVRRELEQAIENLSQKSAEERIRLFWAAHDEGADGLWRELGIAGVSAAKSQAVVTLIDDTAKRFSELHRRILRDAEDIYRQVLSEGIKMAVMGVETTQQAIARTLNMFADRGITAFVDKSGRRWGMAEYSEMAVRTGMMHSAIAGYTQEALAHGEDLVIISDHTDECPLCAVWENVVLSLTGAQINHPDCHGTVAEAHDAGLFHPHCKHSMTVYVPGLTSKGRAPSSYQKPEDAAGYKARQLQRYMERTLRKWKRRQAAATTPEDERIARAYVTKWQGKLRAHTGNVKLPRKYSREGGRVVMSEAARKLKPAAITTTGHYAPKQ